MIDITRFAELVPGDHGLTVVALALPDRTVHASVANAGNLNHPVTGARSPASSPRAGPPSAITSETTHAPPSCCASAGVLRLADIGDRGDFARPPADGADSVVHRLPWPCAYMRLAGGTGGAGL
jgi:hypothetical protein